MAYLMSGSSRPERSNSNAISALCIQRKQELHRVRFTKTSSRQSETQPDGRQFDRQTYWD